MPWFPELFSASVLDRIRRDAADARAAEPVPYFDWVMSGEIDALVGSFAGEPNRFTDGKPLSARSCERSCGSGAWSGRPTSRHWRFTS